MMNDNFIFINDVGPRDGLQNQPKILSIEQRIALINALVWAGLPGIEVGAFVSPKAVPAMAGTDQVFSAVKEHADVVLSALIPNLRGFETGNSLNVPLMSLVVAASNTMNEKNIRINTAESLSVCEQVLSQAKQSKAKVQAYVATAWECPFEGIVNPNVVRDVCGQLFSMGTEHIVIADTIGAGAPDKVHSLMTSLAGEFGAEKLSCHFHDTRGFGTANVYAAIEAGIRQFDASVAGLGGCPFAPGASGNVATEDVVLLAEQMGYRTGIDMNKLLQASRLASEITGSAKGGNARSWLERQYKISQQEAVA